MFGVIVSVTMLLNVAYAAEDIDIKQFQKEIDPKVSEWTKDLRNRVNKDQGSQIMGIAFGSLSSNLPYITTSQKEEASRIVKKFDDVTNKVFGIESSHDNGSQNTDFFIFVSFSMGEKNLEHLMKVAQKYNGIVVLRGLPPKGIKEIAKFVTKLSQKFPKIAGGFAIDPTLFQEYEVVKVPTFVLAKTCAGLGTCDKKYDILTGNVSPRFALEKFSYSGDLSSEARERLG